MTAAQVDLLLVIARVYLRAGRFGTALHLLDVLLAADPGHADALRARAVLLDRLGHHDAALDVIDRLLRDDPADSALHLLRGLVLEALGRREEGRAAFAAFQSRRPRVAGAGSGG